MTLTKIKPAGLSKPVDLADNEKIRLGTGNDLEIYFDDTHSRLVHTPSTGDLVIQSDDIYLTNAAGNSYYLRGINSGAVELYYNNVKFFETGSTANFSRTIAPSSNGGYDLGLNATRWRHVRTVDDGKVMIGNSDDLQLHHDGSNRYIDNNTGVLNVRSLGTGANVQIIADSDYMARFINDGAVELYYDNSLKFFTNADGAHFGSNTLRGDDNAIVALGSGTSGDLRIYHDGNYNIFRGARAHSTQFWTNDSPRWRIKADGNIMPETNNAYNIGQADYRVVNLYLSNALDLADGATVQFGNDDDLKIYHDGNHSRIDDVGTGSLLIQTNGGSIQLNKGTTENMLVAYTDAGVDLYYNNARKLSTHNTGIEVKNSGGSYVQIDMEPSSANPAGFVYANTSDQIGFLDSGGSWAIRHQNDSHTLIRDNATTRLRIDSDGIKFGGDTAAANGMNDYEEGTWTPTVRGGTSAGTATYSARLGNYVKVGKLVTLSFYVVWSNFDGTGPLEFSGLPYATWNNNGLQHAGPVMTLNLNYPTNSVNVVTHNWNGVSYFRLYGSYSGGGWDAVQCDGSAGVIGTLTYFAPVG